MAGALPDISIADVLIPQGTPLAQFAYANYSYKVNSTLGALIAVNTPFTVNTTAAVNAYLAVSHFAVLKSKSYVPILHSYTLLPRALTDPCPWVP